MVAAAMVAVLEDGDLEPVVAVVAQVVVEANMVVDMATTMGTAESPSLVLEIK
jgi:hypothetical protein